MKTERIWQSLSRSPEETACIIKSRIGCIALPYVIHLNGELGTGKTFISKKIGEIYGHYEMSSPTFNKVSINVGEVNIIHCDFYHISNHERFYHSEIEEHIDEATIILTEWSTVKLNINIPSFLLLLETVDINSRFLRFTSI